MSIRDCLRSSVVCGQATGRETVQELCRILHLAPPKHVPRHGRWPSGHSSEDIKLTRGLCGCDCRCVSKQLVTTELGVRMYDCVWGMLGSGSQHKPLVHDMDRRHCLQI